MKQWSMPEKGLNWRMMTTFVDSISFNALPDALFDVNQNSKTAKELWDALHAKYLTNDATSK